MKLKHLVGVLLIYTSFGANAGQYDNVLCYDNDRDIYALNYETFIYNIADAIPSDYIVQLSEFFKIFQSYGEFDGESGWVVFPDGVMTRTGGPILLGELISRLAVGNEITFGYRCEFEMTEQNKYTLNFSTSKPDNKPKQNKKKTVIFIHTDLLGTPVAQSNKNGDVQ